MRINKAVFDRFGYGKIPYKEEVEHTTPLFGIWILRPGITLRVFGWLFQIKLTKNELPSQWQDISRWRFLGLSIKLFGSRRRQKP